MTSNALEPTVLQAVNPKSLPEGVPPVPRGYTLGANSEGVVFTFRKKGGSPPFILRSNEELTTFAWKPADDFPTEDLRAKMIAMGLKTEIKFPGMRMTAKAPKCTTILRKEYGMTGEPLSLYVQWCRFRGIDMDKELLERAMAEGIR